MYEYQVITQSELYRRYSRIDADWYANYSHAVTEFCKANGGGWRLEKIGGEKHTTLYFERWVDSPD